MAGFDYCSDTYRVDRSIYDMLFGRLENEILNYKINEKYNLISYQGAVEAIAMAMKVGVNGYCDEVWKRFGEFGEVLPGLVVIRP